VAANKAKGASATTHYLTALAVNRAASDIDALDTFYVDGMKCSTTLSVEETGVTKRCYLWSYTTVDVCFTVRPDSATSTDWKVSSMRVDPIDRRGD
jgi:hypothetical protein